MSDRDAPALECRLWWATAGTMCVVVCAATREDACVLAAARFADAGKSFWREKVEPATWAQWARYQAVLSESIELDRTRAAVHAPDTTEAML